jgi:hypothetical protein
MELNVIIRLFLEAYALFPLNILFWLVIVLVGSQYRRMARSEVQLLGKAKNSVRKQTFYSALFGLAGGLLASVLLVFFGISLMDIGIQYVWPVAILLLLVHPRYLCFAYAGGLVGVVSVLLQLLGQMYPALTQGFLAGIAGIHIPGLLALIGILHLTESFLIAVSGHLFPSPIYVKTQQGVVGGFSLQKFWPLPLVGLVAILIPQATAETVIGAQMPDWWPLLASTTVPGAGETLMYMLTPIVAGLGYGDLAISTDPREKSKRSALNLGLYSLLLLGAAFLAHFVPFLMIPAALFSPFGHEFLIQAGNKREFTGKPLFAAPEYGLKVLDVFSGSPAEDSGLESGDIIFAVNRFPVNDSLTYHNLVRMAGPELELTVQKLQSTYTVTLTSSVDPGIILAPDRFTRVYAEIKHKHFFSALSEKLQRVKHKQFKSRN